jgi:hypothetical protein
LDIGDYITFGIRRMKTAYNITYTQAGVSCFVRQESAKFKVQFFVDSSVIKTPTFGKPKTVSRHPMKRPTNIEHTDIMNLTNFKNEY